MRSHLLESFLRTRSNPSSGMTLIELLVVIAIMAILAAISLPSFLNRANAAKQVEAKTMVSALNRAQQAYYMEHTKFAQQVDLLVTKAPTSHYYDYLVKVTPGVSFAEHHAVPKPGKMRAYVGMTAAVQLPTSEVTSQSVLCESDDFRQQEAPTPLYNVDSIDCAAGTHHLD